MLIDKLIKRVDALQLDLKGKTVLTEAASGAYVVTPVLAALAGARVLAYTRTTRYGTAEDVIKNTRELADSYSRGSLDISFPAELGPDVLSMADIITNSGHLRPLDENKLQHVKEKVVIPLMYEAWEWRDADMDIDYIRKRGIRVGATNERHPGVDVFNYLGDMALKQIFDAGICPYKNRFVLLCNNDFGPFIAKVLARNCDGLAIIDKDENREKYDMPNVHWVGGFPEIAVPPGFEDAEAILFTAYPFDQEWVGGEGPIRVEQLRSVFKDPYILRYAGDVNTEALGRSGVRYYPLQVSSGHMGILPSAIGFDPIIRLQAGGLKVGELLLKNQTEYQGIPLVENISEHADH